MPKGGIIFAPLLIKKFLGPLSFTGADLQIFAAKAAASLLLWISFKALMTFKNKSAKAQEEASLITSEQS